MKIIITSLVSLLVGVAVGWYVGYTRPIAKADRHVWQELQDADDESGRAALYSMGAIQMIDAGEPQKAVQVLSVPIADFYVLSTLNPSTNEFRLKIRDLIERLARTNQVVAVQIKEASTNYWPKTR